MFGHERRLRGGQVVGAATLFVVVLVAAIILTAGLHGAALRAVIRATARTSFVLFIAAFTAPALDALVARRWTHRLREYEGALFVSFAVSHLVHALAILLLAAATNGVSWRAVGASQIYGGGLAYVFIFWLACGALGGARFERRPWRPLRSFALYYIWFIFMFSYGGRAAGESLRFVPLVLVLLVALALRLTAAFAHRPVLQTAN
jgi:sulfoxide reductase heme-binding subunit YedZ